uniref:catechol O-methyltransferase n=1 Tax=Mycena chlorophos TaxID=658473 RepID=A0ABQ0M9Z8_MYCCL|nr:catechol O-methyltransferase [Mycena chlorophos]
MEDLKAKLSPELLQKYPSLKKVSLDTPWHGDGREQRVLEYIYARPDLATLRNNPARVCAAIEEFSINEELLMNVGSSKVGVVTDLIAAEKPRVVVEMGCYVGYSAIAFASALRAQHPTGPKPQYWSLEFSPLFASIAMNLVDLAGLSDIVKIVTGPAGTSIERLAQEAKIAQIDLLFIDHMPDNYRPDLQTCESLGLLKSGALVVADNVLIPGAPDYTEYVRTHKGLETRAVKVLTVPGDFDDEIEITKVK